MKQIFFAQKALIVKDDKLLMIQKSKNERPNPLRWDLPGGRMEFGETPDNSLAREVFEETGVRVKTGNPYYLGQWFVTRQRDNETVEMQIVAVFRACVMISDENFTTINSTETDEIERIEWVPINEIFNRDLMPGIIDSLKSFINDINNNKIEFPKSV